MTDFLVLGIILYAINNLPDGVLDARQRTDKMVMVKCAEHRNSNRRCQDLLPGKDFLCSTGTASESQYRGRGVADRNSHGTTQGRFAEVLQKEKYR
jgi:hypothetical protein